MAKRYCSQCRDGERLIEADFEVIGTVTRKGRKVPYHAFLCDGHLEILCEDYETELLAIPIKQGSEAFSR